MSEPIAPKRKPAISREISVPLFRFFSLPDQK
jgi:hypothetical protein